MKLSTKPYNGTKDFIFKDFERLDYIFSSWRKVCKHFGFSEYILPILEPAELYEAKSGEELVNEQLYTLTDKGGRRLAIRPEATPSIARVAAKQYKQVTKPIKVFSILNFMRYERPQSGRMREFFQLNADIFGTDNLLTDILLISVALESILVFGPPKGAFRFFINDRHLMFEALRELGINTEVMQRKVLRFIDRFGKLDSNEFDKELTLLLDGLRSLRLRSSHLSRVQEFLGILYSTRFEELDMETALNKVELFGKLKRTTYVFDLLQQLDGVARYKGIIKFNPAIVRGLDYYDGVVFEAFDTTPMNKRSLLGGGRYNGLGRLFGIEDLPAIGFGVGNYTLENFLDNWRLWDKQKRKQIRVFVPILKGIVPSRVYDILGDSNFMHKVYKHIAEQLDLRSGSEGAKIDRDDAPTEEVSYVKTITSFDVSVKTYSVTSALRFAGKRGYDFVLILGERELGTKKVNLKYL